jgi:hypothetical protein
MAGQEKGVLLKQVTAWADLTVFILYGLMLYLIH